MSDGHGDHGAHDSHGGHKEEKSGGKTDMVEQAVDRLGKRIEDYVTGGISKLVASILFLITIGAAYGFIAASRGAPIAEYFVIAPAIAGLVAYYNRTFAVLIFTLLVILLVFVPL